MKTYAIQVLRCILLTGIFVDTGIFSAQAQYPYSIEMSHAMIGNAEILAQLEIVHRPGFEAKTGLDYDARIDPNFAGNGTAYDPPSGFGNPDVSPSNMNYIITKTPQIAGFLTNGTYNSAQVSTDISYFDGLGRPYQDVSVMASPRQKDVIKPYTYDNAGRPDATFIPYEYEPTNGKNGQFDGSYLVNQRNFIEQNFGPINKNFGFSKPLYEESPLNRVLKQSAPGAD